ncbi:hypothetical protein MLD38_013205 [Melastoma candidum]|uniref:Uncharacterized protein n=1 Tax=Melastoma candidum TaxID=119954 RepID=A0ACB9RHA4_9MYRT|nr:hypothetical protein MLD38_013205 [Melastoma candidum]
MRGSGGYSSLASRIVVMGIAASVVLLFLVIAMLILVHFCVARRAIMRAFGNGPPTAERNGPGNASGDSQRIDLEKLPSFDFREREVGSSPVNCAVCLENFRGGDKCRLLPICKHSFHMECVDEWLLAKAHCPICRGSANSVEMAGNPVGLGSHTDGIAGVNGTETGLEDGQIDRQPPHELSLENRNQSVPAIESH